MIVGVGLDVCDIARMEALLADGRFLGRFFAPEEQEYIENKGKGAARTMAGIFAAKEALVKALGTGFGPLAPADVEITHDASGAPAYLINEKTRSALQARGAQSAFLSVTHDGDYAMATAILEG